MKKLIIVEGPQGTGKTTLTNYLRDNLPAINLYRLQGQKDKTLTGKEVSTKMYDYLLNYMNKCKILKWICFLIEHFSQKKYMQD